VAAGNCVFPPFFFASAIYWSVSTASRDGRFFLSGVIFSLHCFPIKNNFCTLASVYSACVTLLRKKGGNLNYVSGSTRKTAHEESPPLPNEGSFLINNP
jgi:hypothetical protein